MGTPPITFGSSLERPLPRPTIEIHLTRTPRSFTSKARHEKPSLAGRFAPGRALRWDNGMQLGDCVDRLAWTNQITRFTALDAGEHRAQFTWPGTPEGDLSRKVSNRAGLLFALVSLECSVEGGAVDVEHLGEVVEVHAGVE